MTELDRTADLINIGVSGFMYLQKKGLTARTPRDYRTGRGCGLRTCYKIVAETCRGIMKNILTIVILAACAAVSYPNSVRAQRSLHYQPETVELEGKLVIQSKYGPPNFGEDPKTDQKVRIPVLVLKTPVNVLPIEGTDDGINTEPVYRVRQIQLSFAVGGMDHKKLIGKNVVVKGTLFRAHTGHHYTDVVLTVRSIEKK